MAPSSSTTNQLVSQLREEYVSSQQEYCRQLDRLETDILRAYHTRCIRLHLRFTRSLDVMMRRLMRSGVDVDEPFFDFLMQTWERALSSVDGFGEIDGLAAMRQTLRMHCNNMLPFRPVSEFRQLSDEFERVNIASQ